MLDLATGQVARQAWLDDPGREPPGAHREATVPAWVRGRLLVPSRAAVYAVDPVGLGATRVVDHPLCTDLHSVAPRSAGGVWLSSTGIDAVLGIGAKGELERWDLAEPVPGEDFRHVPYTALKPHRVHPNCAVEWGGTLWVTCFEQREAVSRDGRRIALPEGMPHDGHLREGLVWFTTVTGHVIAIDPETLERREHYDLNALTGSKRALGWCRGVEVIGDRVFVGMTQLRKSAHVEVLRWLARGEAGRLLPSRIVELSRGEGRVVREIPLGNRAGATIHGLLALSPRGG